MRPAAVRPRRRMRIDGASPSARSVVPAGSPATISWTSAGLKYRQPAGGRVTVPEPLSGTTQGTACTAESGAIDTIAAQRTTLIHVAQWFFIFPPKMAHQPPDQPLVECRQPLVM